MSCENINECDTRNEWGYLPCSPNAQCHDFQGTYTCSCYPGFTGAGTHGDPCVDEDECSLGKDNCLGKFLYLCVSYGNFSQSRTSVELKTHLSECNMYQW